MVGRGVVGLAVAGLLLVTGVPPLEARQMDDSRAEPFPWRQWVYGAIGVAVGVIPAIIVSDDGSRTAWCGRPSRCDAITAGAMAGTVGFLIGRERDRVALRKWRTGHTLPVQSVSAKLDFAPLRLLPSQAGGAIIVGEPGVVLVRPDLRLAAHRGEVRGVITAADLPRHEILLVGAAQGVFAFSVAESGGARRDAGGVRLARARAEALLPLDSAFVVVASHAAITRLSLSARAGRLEASVAASSPAADSLVAAAVSEATGTLWTLEGARVRARDTSSLEPLGELRLTAPGRSLVVDGLVGAVSAGANGVFLLDLARPTEPRRGETVDLDAVHLEAGMALHRGRLYIAAGQQGLVVVEVPDPYTWRLSGVVRDIGSVDGVAASGLGVYVLDRRARQVRRVEVRDRGK